jgi:serine/threonine-protein kinase RsbW
MEKRFPRDFESLPSIFDYIAEFMALNKINNSATYALQFIVEELFTNLVKYSRGGQEEILVMLSKQGDAVRMQLTDFDVDEFDPTTLPDVNIQEPAQTRKVGGLGVHLVRKMVDTMTYEYSNRVGTITITKNLGPEDVQRIDRKQ